MTLSDIDTCGNCGQETGNEPFRLCDERNDERESTTAQSTLVDEKEVLRDALRSARHAIDNRANRANREDFDLALRIIDAALAYGS